jgi:phenylacetate-CoA ligase
MVGVREQLLGPSYFHHRHLISKSRTWSSREILAYQTARMNRLTRRYGDEVTQKDDYRNDPRRYARWKLPLLTHTVRTSGTSGQPLRFTADTFSRRQKERAYLFDIWSQAGYAPYDLRVRYAGDMHAGLLSYNRLENVWVVSPRETVGSEIGRMRRWLRTLPRFFLHVYPSSLYTFIDLVGEDLFRSLPIRGVIAASEMFPVDEQLRFEREFGLKIAHWYGHSEYATLAYCCRECRGFHFYPTYGHVELLASDIDGCRRVVASSFNRLGTQFVRYDTGDLAVSALGSCAADNFPRASAIVGRSQETFIDNSGLRRSLFGYAFGDLDHDAFYDHIRDIQFVQDKAGALRVRVVPSPGAEKGLIERTFERRLPMASLEFEYVPIIERSPSGKRRYFVDGLRTDVRPWLTSGSSRILGRSADRSADRSAKALVVIVGAQKHRGDLFDPRLAHHLADSRDPSCRRPAGCHHRHHARRPSAQVLCADCRV